MHYAKLFGAIVHSTIWREPMHVRIVWVTLLALKDRDGEVMASVPGLADAARVTVDQCRDALRVLSSPDPDSTSPALEGRRITTIEGGWWIVNSDKYEALKSKDEKRVRDAERQDRKRKRDSQSVTVTGERDNPQSHEKSPLSNSNSYSNRSPLPPSKTAGVEPSADAQTPAGAGDPGSEPSMGSEGETKPKRSSRAKRAPAPEVPLPDDWAPAKTHRAYAAKHGLEVELEADAMRGWAEGRQAVSWNGTFTTRLANAVKWKRERGLPARKPGSPDAGEERFL